MSKARVLVVEDEKIVARDISNRLDSMGYTVTAVVATGEQAIKDAERTSPDIVLMDIVLKGEVDGIEAATRIIEKLDLPVVYLTAYTDEKTLQRAKITEPFGYVVKPFEDRELHINIEMALRKHASQKALKESEERFRTMAENSQEGILIHDIDNIMDFNGMFARMFGYKPDELKHMNPMEIVAPECRALKEKHARGGFDQLYECTGLRKDGSRFPVEFIGKRIKYQGKQARIVAVRDLTERKKVEKLERERSRAELYGFVVSALPLITPGMIEGVREDLVKTFADRFERHFKPKFDEEMTRLKKEASEATGEKEGRDGKEAKGARDGRAFDPLEAYLHWVADLFTSLGIEAAHSAKEGSGAVEFRGCPWISYAKNNPVFCLLCRAMAFRSFVWVSPKGAVGLRTTLAGGGKCCAFEFRQQPIKGR